MHSLGGLCDVAVGVEVGPQCCEEVGLIGDVVPADSVDDVEPSQVVVGKGNDEDNQE